MTILDRYLLNKFLIPFLYGVSGFISVWLVWDLSVNLPDFLSGHATFALVARYYLLQIPSVIVLSVPVGLLLALLYTLTQMSRRNEIISMLCAGMSLYRIFIPLVIVGLVMTGVLATLNYRLAPQSGSSSEEIRARSNQVRSPSTESATISSATGRTGDSGISMPFTRRLIRPRISRSSSRTSRAS